jgi:SAM-dependent methyltransferase
MFHIKRKLERLSYILRGQDKEFAEIKFWRRQIDIYKKWYTGEIDTLYDNPSPRKKADAFLLKEKALAEFFETHQIKKYLVDLQLQNTDFSNMKVLDIGSGPFPNTLCFKNCESYSLDPLLHKYIEAGYPIHCYENRAKFIQAFAEEIPFPNHFFDAVVSVNAIDHVNSFALTAKEIQRILKPGGKFRMHVHYHKKTKAEPIELNDDIFLKHYEWVSDLKKINESKIKTGSVVESSDERYVLWGN